MVLQPALCGRRTVWREGTDAAIHCGSGNKRRVETSKIAGFGLGF